MKNVLLEMFNQPEYYYYNITLNRAANRTNEEVEKKKQETNTHCEDLAHADPTIIGTDKCISL